MLNSCYILQKHISPAKEGCTSFGGNPAFLKKTREYFARDSGKVHATIPVVPHKAVAEVSKIGNL